MARVMMKSSGGAAGGGFWGGDAPQRQSAWNAGAARGAGRRGWASTAWLVAGTLAVALTSYSLSLKVSGERRETDRLARENRALEGELKALDAELRVRMRMPQLQRWNDSVLGLVPISASQYLESPVSLANYGKPLETGLPSVQLAVRDVPQSNAIPAPRLVSAEAAPAANSPAEPLLKVAAEESAPSDLLQQVEMAFPPNPGVNR